MKSLREMSLDQRRACFATLAPKCRFQPGLLAAECHVCLRNLERIFRDDFGATPQDQLHRMRMQSAMLLLHEGRSIKETSYHLGYTQPTHFSRDFKKYYSRTPSSVRPFSAHAGA